MVFEQLAQRKFCEPAILSQYIRVLALYRFVLWYSSNELPSSHDGMIDTVQMKDSAFMAFGSVVVSVDIVFERIDIHLHLRVCRICDRLDVCERYGYVFHYVGREYHYGRVDRRVILDRLSSSNVMVVFCVIGTFFRFIGMSTVDALNWTALPFITPVLRNWPCCSESVAHSAVRSRCRSYFRLARDSAQPQLNWGLIAIRQLRISVGLVRPLLY